MSEESEKTLLISKGSAERSGRGASYTEIDETDLSGKDFYKNSDNSKSLDAQDYNAAIRSRKSTIVINPENRIRKVNTRHRADSIVGDLTPVTLSWEHVNARVVPREGCFSRMKSICFKQKATGKPKQVLRDVNGIARPGTLLAIIGSSGAGKTTLMNVLTMRLTSLQVEGTVRVNGVEIGKEISSLSAYCQQNDLFIGTLTVREHLTFRANLGLGGDVSAGIRKQRVEEVLKEVGLIKCANTMIGIAGRIRGVSGGEAKRLSFASEILTNPALMFCDEPTSGLDSFMALTVVQTLKDMASRGRTIICTIHQPSSEVFVLFDQLLIMADGRVAYMGPTSDAATFFNDQGYPCPIRYNPSDYYIYTMAVFPGREVESLERITNICNTFDQTREAESIMSGITDDILSSTEEDTALVRNEAMAIKKYRAGWFRQFGALLVRSWLGIVREPILMRARLVQTVIISTIIGLVYLQQQLTQQGVQNINGLLFIVQMNMSFMTLMAVVNVFPKEIPIFMREHGSRLYRVDSYFLAKNIAELPTFILLPILYGCIAYWMGGLYPEVGKFFIFLGVFVFACNIGVSLGYMIATGSGTPDMALAVAPPLLIPLVLFGGFYLNTESVPGFLIWMQYLSWFRYTNEVLVVSQWSGVTHIDCPTNSNSSQSIESTACYNNGDDVISMMNFSVDNVPMDLGLMVALFLGYRIMAFLFLLIRSRKA